MASIYKRGKSYTASVSVKDGPKYRKKSKSGFRTKSAAKAWAVKMENYKAKGFVSFDESQPLSEYFHDWYTTYKLDMSRATQMWYHTTELYIEEHMQNVTLGSLNRPTFQRFLNTLAKKYSDETVNKVRNIMHQAIKSAIYDDIIFKDPIDGIYAKGKQGKSSDLKYLEEPQMKALVDYIQSINLTDRTDSDMMILLALNTGVRYEEAAALTWQDMNQGVISINKAWEQVERAIKEPKTKSSVRKISVPATLLEQFYTWKRPERATDFVFGMPRPITSAAVNKRLKVDLQAIQSPKIITFHGLRHTHASWLLSHGVDIQYVSARLGHKSVGMTLRVYTHMLDNLKREEDEKSVNLLENL